MRSRYTAYTMANMEYIQQTMCGKAIGHFDEVSAQRWAKKVSWIKLKVIESCIENQDSGFVEFEASFVEAARLKSIHERSEFIRRDGRWFYSDGVHLPASFNEQTISRNMNCPCGSPRKFKNCHGVRDLCL